MMASKDEALRTSAMTYFITNHQTNGYASFDLRDTRKAFLPLQGSSRLVSPGACFTNEEGICPWL